MLTTHPHTPLHSQAGKGGIIANPNCSTIIALTAVTPLHRAATVQRMVVSTYQAASGAGAAAMAELEQQTREVLDGKPVTTNIFPFQARSTHARRQEPALRFEERAGEGKGGVDATYRLICLDFGRPLRGPVERTSYT